jgi:hypothetical protein
VPTRVRNLSPAGYVTVVATVAIPAEAYSGTEVLPYTSDTVTITALVEDGPSVAPVSSVLITKLWIEQQVFLPLVMWTSDVDRFLFVLDTPLF